MKKLVIIVSSVFILGACQDVIDVDVPEADPEIVIDGWITDKNPASVRLSLTDSYFEEGETPVVSGAEITLFENDIAVDVLTELDAEPGNYRGSFVGSIGNTYTISVQTPDDLPGKASGLFTSAPELLNRVASIDSMEIAYLTRNTEPAVFEDGDYTLLYFQEPAGEGDFFRISRWLGDSLFQRDVLLVEDEGIDGFYFGDEFIPPINIFGPFDEDNRNQYLKIQFESINSDYNDYLNLVVNQTTVGSPFDAPPALVLGNIYRSGDVNDYAFGYFRASALSTDSILYNP